MTQGTGNLSSALRCPVRRIGGMAQSALVLGTVQLGLRYGAVNATGMPSADVAAAIVSEAVAYGVTHVDTARVYGESEARLGVVLDGVPEVSVITKLSPLNELKAGDGPSVILAAVDASIDESTRALKRSKLDVVLLHRAEHLTRFGGLIWSRLKSLQGTGAIGFLGVSVQNPEELLRALREPEVKFIQLPFNLLDWRWNQAGVPQALLSRPDIVVHARSVLLQGVLTSTTASSWPVTDGDSPMQCIDALSAITELLGRKDRVDLCIAFVRAQTWIHGLVLGVETIEQLRRNIFYFEQQPLTSDEATLVAARIPRVSTTLLDPARWGSNR